MPSASLKTAVAQSIVLIAVTDAGIWRALADFLTRWLMESGSIAGKGLFDDLF
jgi:hypothetical protein